MYFVLDIVCVAILVGSVLRYWSHHVSHVLLKCLCVAIAVTVAAVAGMPLAQAVCERWTAPYVERKATLELGEILTGRRAETADAVDLSRVHTLVYSRPVPYEEWLAEYGATADTAEQAYQVHRSGAEMVQAVTEEYTFHLTRAATYAVLWLVAFLLCCWIMRKIEWNMTEAPPSRGLARVWAPLSGVLYGVLMVSSLTLLLEWLIPAVSGNSVLWSEEMLAKGTVYPFLKQINPFVRLYF